jgi:hypothetical protein
MQPDAKNPHIDLTPDQLHDYHERVGIMVHEGRETLPRAEASALS